jgi:hypothetical protein
MGAATTLITSERKRTVQRAVLMIAVAILPYLISPKIPAPYQWLFFPLVAFVMFGIPIGLMLLGESFVARRKWSAPLLSALLFTAAWGVWMARGYFQRLQY